MMHVYKRAEDLPDDWDHIAADNYALKKEFLITTQRANTSVHTFYVFRKTNGTIDSILVTFYKKRFNILLYTPIIMRINVTLVHIPLSITRQGYIIGDETRDEVERLLNSLKGYVVLLNAGAELRFKNFHQGTISSQISMPITWKTFDEYLNDLRSHYRYRYKKALKKGAGLTFTVLRNNTLFDEELYSFYEAVFNKSKIRVEKLTIDFFRSSHGTIIVCEHKGQKLGFIQMIENGRELVFAFVGINYPYNHRYDIYLNLLLHMMEYAITHGFTTLELGQTAEDTKLKLGGRFTPLYALLHHSNPVINMIINRIVSLISYKQSVIRFRVFKEGGDR